MRSGQALGILDGFLDLSLPQDGPRSTIQHIRDVESSQWMPVSRCRATMYEGTLTPPQALLRAVLWRRPHLRPMQTRHATANRAGQG